MSAADTPAAGAHPSVTVSLVTHNGVRWLNGCLASLRAQTLSQFELLVIDNASTDGTPDLLRRTQAELPWLSLDQSSVNLGFAAAHNRNIIRARGEFICLLNQDVELDGGFLRAALDAFDGTPTVAAVQGRLRRLSPTGGRTDVIDTTGLVMQRNRRALSRGQGEGDGPAYGVAGPVWGADGPAPVYRRSALMTVREPRTGGGWEILDEDFFMYKEDVDLAWRLRRRGWQTWYQPTALAWHGRSAGGGPSSSLLDVARTNRSIPRWIKAMSWRNQHLMQIKNDRLGDVLRDLPWIAAREVMSLAFMLVADTRRLSAIPATLRLTRAALRKRRAIEAARVRRG